MGGGGGGGFMKKTLFAFLGLALFIAIVSIVALVGKVGNSTALVQETSAAMSCAQRCAYYYNVCNQTHQSYCTSKYYACRRACGS